MTRFENLAKLTNLSDLKDFVEDKIYVLPIYSSS